MSEFFCNSMPTHTSGDLLKIGSKAPDFLLTETDLSLVTLNDYAGQALLLNVFVSIDTPVCIKSCEKFNHLNDNTLNILCVSMDTPFAMARALREKPKIFNHLNLLSDFRNRHFGEAYHLTIIDGPLAGFLARDMIVLDKAHRIVYQELSQEITQAPNFDLAVEALRDSQ